MCAHYQKRLVNIPFGYPTTPRIFARFNNQNIVRWGLFIMFLVVTGLAWGQALKKDSKPLPLFWVKDTPVYADEFIYLYKKNHLKPDDFSEVKINEYLNLLVNFKLKVMEARARGLDTTVSFQREFKSYSDELKKPYIAQKDELDRLTKEAYERLTEEVKASHILITIKPDAVPEDTLVAYNKITSIRARIMDGKDFEKMAREISEDPSAKTNGGNLGYFSALQMVYPFEQAAFSLKVAEISQPVRTRFGYHLIKVTDRKPARGEVEVSHIILRTGSGDDIKVKNKIFEIFEQLQGGRSWDELCKEFSDDPATKDSGGRLRPFGIGTLTGIPEFEAVAFSLKEPGEISDPFQSAYGWHIVRLEKKVSVPPFTEVEATLRRKVARDERLKIADLKIMEERKKQYNFSEDPLVLKWFIDTADSNLRNGKWKFSGDNALEQKKLFAIQGKSYTAKEFATFIQKNQTTNSLTAAAYMQQLYNRFVEEKIDEEEEARLQAENPEFRNLLIEYKEGILLFTIMEKEVWNRDSGDSVGLKKTYEVNKERYHADERVRARIFSSTDKKFLDEIRRKVTAGDSLGKADLKKFKSVVPVRNFEKGENKAVDLLPWAMGLHDAQVDETYYLVEIQSLIPPGIKSFDEARAQVVTDYQETLEKKWIEELKLKYPVRFNNKGKKFVVSELTKK